ncbi:MAG TPA: elongation factor P hydroxylase [Cellvibrionaceae bacterium]|nr:elongation factor P hydroxylase [Cellvibrionaceae bacterium]HMW47885.1 elongation factor P hydroxylase [Cellvibrionaceae bacterium]HMY38285.1 elongation factor P hydroxylase [Marinagarivorans sp.]HNG60023.1 elongation factor P hydroxylase [Cellvibrionaceae bacterium]
MQSGEYSYAAAQSSVPEISGEVLIRLFNELFVPQVRTCLCGGAEEPIYLPASAVRQFNEIHFTRDYCASALHEIAHWCVAGKERRKQIDFGYWYAPDGRSQEQQAQFEQVEIKPQALEWIFSVAAGMRFRVSADNLAQGIGASVAFKRAVAQQAQYYCSVGLPVRAAQWAQTLADFFCVSDPLDSRHYKYEFLGE